MYDLLQTILDPRDDLYAIKGAKRSTSQRLEVEKKNMEGVVFTLVTNHLYLDVGAGSNMEVDECEPKRFKRHQRSGEPLSRSAYKVPLGRPPRSGHGKSRAESRATCTLPRDRCE